MFGQAGFTHLDARSSFSLKEGTFSPEQLVGAAAEAGFSAVSLTDRDALYGASRFVRACDSAGLRPLLGASLTLDADPVQPPHLTVLATDDRGYANLCRLITDARMTGQRGEPSLDVAQVCAHSAGLVAIAGPRSPAGRSAIAGAPDSGALWLQSLREAMGPQRLFIGVENRMEAGSRREVRAMLDLAERTELRPVGTNPVRYLSTRDAALADILECMRKIVPLAPNNVSRTNAEGWLKPASEMRALFAERPDLCDATLDITEMCGFDLGLGGIHFPEFPTPAGRSADAVLAERCWRGVGERGVARTEKLRSRLHDELSMIRRMGYAAYFLTVADIVADIKSMGIPCACRGSAAGSLVCYLIGISDVDALRHDLSFERFINPLRKDLPDIDIDVESARREDVYDMILSRHGDERAACVAMIDTYRARSAIREAGKALGMPDTELDVIAKAFPHISARHVRDAMRRLPELQGLNLNADRLETLFGVVERLDGLPRHVALHPCGIVMASHDLVRRVPLELSAGGHRMIQADKDDVEMLGYLKLDILGVRMLSSMRHAVDQIAVSTGEKVDLDRIPLDDPATFELIRASDTIGCFQIESPGQRELLQKLQPRRWEDLIVEISLFRPGPVKSDMVGPYLRRRAGLEKPTYPHPLLRPALQETFGVIVYHEQVMRTLAAMAGYDLTYADHIRRNLSDPLKVPEMKRDFVKRACERDVDRVSAEETWDRLLQFASFGFCKAHAAAFAVPTYRSAWLKANYPAHLYAGLLTHDPGMYPRRLILEDARRHGVAVLPLDVNMSQREYVVESVETESGSGWGVRLALQDVHGIRETDIRSILLERAERPFSDVGDFMRRTTVSRPVTEALAHAGAFDRTPGANGRRADLYAAMVTETSPEAEQLSLIDEALPEYPFQDYSDAEVVRAELEVMGVDASRHIVSFFEPLLGDIGVTRSTDLKKHRTGERVMVAGVKVASQTPAIRSGQRIIFLTLDDATGPIEVVVFEKVQPKVAKTVFHSYAMAIWGELRRTGVEGVSIVAEEVWDLCDLHSFRAQGRLLERMREIAEGSEARWPSTSPKLWHASGGSAG